MDTVSLADEVSAFMTVTSKENWVGGVHFADQAVVGMNLNKAGTKNNGAVLPMNVQAKKSWFIVEGQIVALGAGISGNTTASIETIVDNRLLNERFTYQVLSNNGPVDQPSESSIKKWLLLQSDKQQANIGYYFPEEIPVNVISEMRKGSYAEINEAFSSSEQYVGDYRKFIINHGKNPINAGYAYVTLPGIDEAGLRAYAEEKPVKILANTAEAQAVELPMENYLGINIWNSAGGNIAGVTTNKAISLLRKTVDKQKTYVFSDPTQTISVMTLKLPKDYTRIVMQSEGINYDNETGTFTINLGNTNGGNKQIVVE